MTKIDHLCYDTNKMKKDLESSEEMKKVIVIVGPTAVGKTKLSIEVAKAFNGEVISGDSMQVYRGMDIGTAKITPEEMEGIPHHLIDIKDPMESFSVAEFQKLVREKIDEITARGKMPIIVGGTGLYVQSVLYDYQFTEQEVDHELRAQLEARIAKGEGALLYEELKQVDPLAAQSIHPNNIRRVMRALEIYYSSGEKKSEMKERKQPGLLYDAAIIALTMDREKLYERINLRVDIMVREGLLEEVKQLYTAGVRNVQSVQAIGYKEIYAYLDGEVSYEQAIEQLKQNSRNYAKRQLTWFRNKIDANWFDIVEKGENSIKEIIQFLAGKLNNSAN